VEPQEVEPLAHVHDPGLGWRQLQTEWLEHAGDVVVQGLNVGAVAVHENDEVVGLCRMPCYAARVDAMAWLAGVRAAGRGITGSDVEQLISAV
jgi:hypothetical protein